ncbi:EAL domain-containing protein [Sphingomonas sp. JC676]|uniref:putative bifunctional diguanylate cyclase/phosphodiesterase n=1 Tax=Sphingomonas sp. JC676 TaxID=2768065 RepID=UPI001657FF8C|nr:EAL domain-containing protein [Sphingomonas sp. JC676]MBC9031180.1 EAL domain-containing protein [Sphingomonas sp. JC676]
MDFAQIWRVIVLHRFAIRNWSLLLLGTLVAFYGAFAIDLFETEGQISLQLAEIELDEALLIGVVLGLVLLSFGAYHYAKQKREMARRIAAERHARELAYQDGLTGLPNRRQYEDALQAAISAPPRAGAAHAIFLIDLNGFKQINDVHGHGIGDEVLIVVAQRLSAAMREGDMVARFGGDEFAILATHLAGPEAATNVALRVIETLDPAITAGGALHRVGVGVGIALVPGDANTIEEALRKADVALYRAKAERRSALRFFEPEMDARVRERDAMERKLRDAIDADRIETMYLPTINLKSQEVIGFEVAPRWIDPEQGEVALERFVAIAEEVGLIHVLAERILRQACEAARSWPKRVMLSADIYPSQLKDALLPARIVRILAETGLAPDRLELEITESALVADMENAQVVLGALRAAGVRIALDNFGTGYSSLYHLRNFKIDKVKIDSSFIHAMASERESASIVSALVGLGHGLGLTIAAEGIDASDQESSLIDSGCEQGQGGLFSGPISASAALSLFPPIKRDIAG